MIVRAQHDYWLESTEHGTMRGKCILASPNQLSLAFINVRCNNCGAEFNITIFFSAVLMAETISRDEPGLYGEVLDFDAVLTKRKARFN